MADKIDIGLLAHNVSFWAQKLHHLVSFWAQNNCCTIFTISGPRNCSFRTISGPRNCTIWSVSGPRIIVAPFLPFLGPEIAVFRPVKGARSPLAREKMKKFKDSKLATQL